MRCTRTQLKLALSGFSVATIAGGAKVRAKKLPDGARVGPVVWPARGDRLACALYSGRWRRALWIVEAATGNARRLDGVRLKTAVVTKAQRRIGTIARSCARATPTRRSARAGLSAIPTGPETRSGELRSELAAAHRARRCAPPPTRSASSASRARGWRAPPCENRQRIHLAPRVGEEPPAFYSFHWYRRTRPMSWSRRLDRRRSGSPSTSGLRRTSRSGRSRRDARPTPVGGGSALNDRSAISERSRRSARATGAGPKDGQALWFFSWQDTPGADAAKAIRDDAVAAGNRSASCGSTRPSPARRRW